LLAADVHDPDLVDRHLIENGAGEIPGITGAFATLKRKLRRKKTSRPRRRNALRALEKSSSPGNRRFAARGKLPSSR
jgi:hypothetical protein